MICQRPMRAVTRMKTKISVRGGRGTELFESKEELKSKQRKGGGGVQTNNRRIQWLFIAFITTLAIELQNRNYKKENLGICI